MIAMNSLPSQPLEPGAPGSGTGLPGSAAAAAQPAEVDFSSLLAATPVADQAVTGTTAAAVPPGPGSLVQLAALPAAEAPAPVPPTQAAAAAPDQDQPQLLSGSADPAGPTPPGASLPLPLRTPAGPTSKIVPQVPTSLPVALAPAEQVEAPSPSRASPPSRIPRADKERTSAAEDAAPEQSATHSTDEDDAVTMVAPPIAPHLQANLPARTSGGASAEATSSGPARSAHPDSMVRPAPPVPDVVSPTASPAPAAAEPRETPSSLPGQARTDPAPVAAMPSPNGTAALPARVDSPRSLATEVRVPLNHDFADRLGLAIARQTHAGRDELTVRMDPAELGHIQVKLGFDDSGSLRAVVSADSPQVLDAIRRDLPEITRALGDAGVRADAQSFTFERGSTDGNSSTGAGGGSAGSSGQRGGQQTGQNAGGQDPRRSEPLWQRPQRRSGRLDLIA